jgi:hypothetical protein
MALRGQTREVRGDRKQLTRDCSDFGKRQFARPLVLDRRVTINFGVGFDLGTRQGIWLTGWMRRFGFRNVLSFKF